MLQFIVLGVVPGTDQEITFESIAFTLTALLLALLLLVYRHNVNGPTYTNQRYISYPSQSSRLAKISFLLRQE